MEIRILMAGEPLGPFSETQVRQYLGEGLVASTDLATFEGTEDWQPIDHLLAQMPPAGETISAEAPPFNMHNHAPPTIEQASAPPPAEAQPPLTASQKTKRKPGKIVIQPILPLEPAGSTRPLPKSGRTALTIEPPRPTTSLPPVAGFVPKERKSGKLPFRTGPVALAGLPGQSFLPPAPPPVAAPAPTPPPAAEETTFSPPPFTPTPSNTGSEISTMKAGLQRIPRRVVYACAGLILLIAVLILLFLYFAAAPTETAPAANAVQPESAAPPVNPAAAQNPEAFPKTTADYSARGFARQAKDDFDGAIADYNQALALDPKNIQALYRRGLAHQAKADWNAVIADDNAVLSLDPRNGDAFSSRAFAKQAMGDPDGAIADYNQALSINPKIPVAYYNMGLIEVQKGDLDGAIAAYSHALDLDPKMAIAYYNRGVAKDTEGNLDGAIADYTQALVLNPKIARAYCDRGSARQAKGDAEGALADYVQALALNPDMAGVYFNRSMIRMQKGDLEGALLDSNQTIKLEPKNAQAYYTRGLARFGKGNLDGAGDDLKTFCTMAPRSSDADTARLYLWLIATEENPKGTADEDLATALQNDWNSPPEDFSSKIAAFLLGHSNETDFIANAASPDPSREPGLYCRAWYFAGMKRLLAGDTTTAISYFQKCLGTNQKTACESIFAGLELQSLKPSPPTPGN